VFDVSNTACRKNEPICIHVMSFVVCVFAITVVKYDAIVVINVTKLSFRRVIWLVIPCFTLYHVFIFAL